MKSAFLNGLYKTNMNYLGITGFIRIIGSLYPYWILYTFNISISILIQVHLSWLIVIVIVYFIVVNIDVSVSICHWLICVILRLLHVQRVHVVILRHCSTLGVVLSTLLKRHRWLNQYASRLCL